MEDWAKANMGGILLGIEIMWVSGFLAIFVIYFFIKHKIKKNKNQKKDPGKGPLEP